MKNRTRIEIYSIMLEALDQNEDGLKITRLSYAVGIPTDRARKYLNFLINAGLVAPNLLDHSYYIITNHGRKFLDAFYVLRGYLGEMDEDINKM
jgi:predicted transcriptional regulator